MSNTIYEPIHKFIEHQNHISQLGNWTEIQGYLLNKDIVNTGSNFIRFLFCQKDVSPKVINSWGRISNLLGVIYNNPNWLCLPNEDSYCLYGDVITHAKYLFLYLSDLDLHNIEEQVLNKLRLQVLNYLGSYHAWSQLDRNTQITRLIEHYLQLDNTKKQVVNSHRLDEAQKQDVLEELTSQQTSLAGYAEKMDGQQGLAIFNQCIQSLDMTTIQNMVEIALWDSILEELKGEGTTEKLKSVLCDFKDLLVSICNRNDCKEIEEIFDIDFLVNKISHSAESLDNILATVDVLCSLLFKYDAPANDEDNRKMVSVTKKDICNVFEELKKQESRIDTVGSKILLHPSTTSKDSVSRDNLRLGGTPIMLTQIVYAYGIIISNFYPQFEKIKAFLDRTEL